MAAPLSSSLLISSPQHGFDSMRPSILGGTKYVASNWGLHGKVNYASRVGVTNWSMPLLSITTTFRKPLVMLDCKKKDLEVVSDVGFGSLVKDGHAFRQNFIIRSYEVGPDRKVLVENLTSYLQETALNHLKAIGLFHEDMGSTPEMSKRSLQWATRKLHVAVDHYPTWGDVVQVDTWNHVSGKYGVRVNWIYCDCKTGKTLGRASSSLVMMNKKTKKLSKIPDEVHAELKQMFLDRPLVVEEDTRKWAKLDESIVDHVRNRIMPRWSDLDANQHVNHVKYIGWILESVPMKIMEKYELASMTLEYRQECRVNDVLQCHTCVLGKNNDLIDCQHMLQLKASGGGNGGDGDNILKGRTKWRPK